MTKILDCPPVPSPELEAIKTRQQAMWASGDFAIIGTTLQIVGETLCEAVDVHAGARVLDVACGNGNAALAAARRAAHVTGVDYVPSLLRGAAARAEAERLVVDLREGDAESLPFADDSFDYVLSTYGVMFAPDQVRAASELVRVCASGGKIGLASWTPTGFIGKLLGVVGAHVPPPSGLKSPALWGSEERIAELFGASARAIRTERKDFVFRYRSPAHFVDVFRRYYGPTYKAFAALDDAGQRALAADIEALCRTWNRDGERSLAAPGEYLEVVIEVA